MERVFAPKDPDFSARVRASFNRQQVMASLGVTLVQVDAGRVELALAFDPKLTQQHGFMHAGIIATALDSACGYAAFSLMPADAGVLSVEYKINFIAPAAAERFSLIGTVIKPGRTLSVCQGEAIGTRGAERFLVATMTCTVMTVHGRENIQQ
ncbi:MAG TPA: PaaI family thioesterase [Steroidobacteraceae bacterium]|nr:PaaI family thioesterase [Steroidobacteraceae bacterium]